MQVILEIWSEGAWQPAATLESLGREERGFSGKVALEYEHDYALAAFGSEGIASLSCRYAPSFELWIEESWPAFMLDVLPGGAARVSMLARMNLPNSSASDWALLTNAQYAPGNLRVQPAEIAPLNSHPGFSRSEVIERGPSFVDYAFERGAPVAGSSGAQGEAPKFLLCQDQEGQWHADGAITDDRVAKQYLVKFPRARHNSDLVILEEEARYMALAEQAQLRANVDLVHEQGCLFVPRFDRIDGDRLGLETLASLSGFSEYGARQPLQASAKCIAQYCTNPEAELCEFLLRDVFNLAMGNTDNHLRNTSVLKHRDGTIALSPLYDVAPMLLDRAGIPRASRWGQHEQAGIIHWAAVLDELVSLGANGPQLTRELERMARFIDELSERMQDQGIHKELVDRLAPSQRALANNLRRGIQS